MIWIVARREFLSNIITLRFLIGFVLCLTLIVSSTYILLDDYTARLKTYDDSVRGHIEELKRMTLFSQLGATVDRPPSKLSFLCIGSGKRIGNIVGIRYDQVPMEATGGVGGSPFMIVFPSLDMILIVQVILSLLVLLFAYNTISGERERGTLAQTLSNSIPRHQLLVGKFVGGMMSVTLPFLVGLLAGIIIVWFSGDIDLKAGDWARLGLVILSSFLYISIFFTLGILTSSLTRRSATSLVILLFLWVVLVIIIPNTAPYLAKQVRPIRDRAAVDNQAMALRSEMQDKLNAYAEKLHKEGMFPETLWTYQYGSISSGYLPYAFNIRYTPKANLRWYLAGTKYRIPLQLEYADKIWALYREYNGDMDRQFSLSNSLSRISPAWTYYNASAILSGTDVENHLTFMEQARRYRQELIDYAQRNGGLASLLYFTSMTMEDAPTTTEAKEMVERLGAKGFGEEMEKRTKGAKPFADIPVFQYQRGGIASSFLRALPDLAILVILNVILFMLAHVSFVRGRVK